MPLAKPKLPMALLATPQLWVLVGLDAVHVVPDAPPVAVTPPVDVTPPVPQWPPVTGSPPVDQRPPVAGTPKPEVPPAEAWVPPAPMPALLAPSVAALPPVLAVPDRLPGPEASGLPPHPNSRSNVKVIAIQVPRMGQHQGTAPSVVASRATLQRRMWNRVMMSPGSWAREHGGRSPVHFNKKSLDVSVAVQVLGSPAGFPDRRESLGCWMAIPRSLGASGR